MMHLEECATSSKLRQTNVLSNFNVFINRFQRNYSLAGDGKEFWDSYFLRLMVFKGML
jgi:hypothetical protein